MMPEIVLAMLQAMFGSGAGTNALKYGKIW